MKLSKRFLDLANQVILKKGDVVFQQHARARKFFLLEHGHVLFQGSSGGSAVPIGQAYGQSIPIGLNPFIDPHRYEFDALVESDTASFLVWEVSELNGAITNNLEEGVEFLKYINIQALSLIEESSELFMTMTGVADEIRPDKFISTGEQSPIEQSEDDSVLFLLQSPFLEVFEEKHLRYLANSLRRIQYPAGTNILHQGDQSEGIDVLESGEIHFSRINNVDDEKQTVWFRSISTPGYLLGASGALNQPSNLTSTVSKDAIVYHIPSKAIEELEKRDKFFGLAMQTRLIWFLANQFRIVQTRLFSAEFEEEIILVTNLIENNQSKIQLSSPLHKVPLLLQDKITSNEAFDLLHDVELNGPNNERNLASLCLDNLKQTDREVKFFNALIDIYKSVTQAPTDSTAEEVQIACNISSQKAFSVPSVQLSGYENLPYQSGVIFIYNHLLNDPFYSLPNQFQITLDAHYLSYLIYEKYGQPAMRIVRIGRESEYAHEDYYDRLGFINVYTSESEEGISTKELKKINRERLQHQFESYLDHGRNIVVSPEGTSYPTEQSPGRFKSGIFRMAMQMEHEPLFVPIVMANFDKRVPQGTYKCRIKEPFKLSEVMSQGEDIKDFLRKYKRQYKTWVTELANE